MARFSDNINASPAPRSRTIGAMLGGAVGGALDATVAFSIVDDFRRRHGNTGITGVASANGRKAAITADTQMALFTAEGLILSAVRAEYAGEGQVITAIYHAYLRWLYTQDERRQGQLIHAHGTCAVIDGILAGHRELFAQRAPDPACLTALASGEMGTVDRPISQSSGCGGLSRAAPIGLAFADSEKSFSLGCAAAALTHGHPHGYLPPGFFAALISRVAAGEPVSTAMAEAARILKKHRHHEACLRSIEAAARLSCSDKDDPASIEALGEGWEAPEALAMGLYCALAAGDDFRQALIMAVNHAGKSDTTAAVAGTLLGACHGVGAIPATWLAGLEMKALIEEVAVDLHEHVCVKSS